MFDPNCIGQENMRFFSDSRSTYIRIAIFIQYVQEVVTHFI